MLEKPKILHSLAEIHKGGSLIDDDSKFEVGEKKRIKKEGKALRRARIQPTSASFIIDENGNEIEKIEGDLPLAKLTGNEETTYRKSFDSKHNNEIFLREINEKNNQNYDKILEDYSAYRAIREKTSELTKTEVSASKFMDKIKLGDRIEKSNIKLSPELNERDQKLQDKIYEEVNKWEGVLKKKLNDPEITDPILKKRNEDKFAEFEKNPYEWAKIANSNSLRKLEGELAGTTDMQKQDTLKRKINALRTNLNNLELAHRDKLPLMLRRKLEEKEITLGEGTVIRAEELCAALNREYGIEATYKIKGMTLRGDDAFLVIDASGNKIEVPIDDAVRMQKFEEIKKGNQIAVYKNGRKLLFNILVKNDAGIKYSIVGGIGRDKEGKMDTDEAMKFLFSPSVKFEVIKLAEKKKVEDIIATSATPNPNPEPPVETATTPESEPVVETKSAEDIEKERKVVENEVKVQARKDLLEHMARLEARLKEQKEAETKSTV